MCTEGHVCVHVLQRDLCVYMYCRGTCVCTCTAEGHVCVHVLQRDVCTCTEEGHECVHVLQMDVCVHTFVL